MYHLFLRRRRVENASFIDPKCVVGTELNIGLESQEMFVLISRQSLFYSIILIVFTTSPWYVDRALQTPMDFRKFVIKMEQTMINVKLWSVYAGYVLFMFTCIMIDFIKHS